MNYYYDVILNWSDDVPYDFFEWVDTDDLELVKKIPLFKVSHKVLQELYTYQIQVDDSFLTSIADKTLVSGDTLVKRVEYAALFTDGKNSIAIEFSRDGISMYRSFLLLDDELGLLEVAYGLKEIEFNYKTMESLMPSSEFRQGVTAKRIINLEINNLYKSKDKSKLMYLYYEYKGYKEDDITIIYNSIIKDLEKGFSKELLKLYYIIKATYNNV